MEGRLQEKVKEALARYNEWRAPEAVAELVELKDDVATIRFTGTFCRTCGVYDYFEDLLGYVGGEILGFDALPEGFLVRFRLGVVPGGWGGQEG